MLILTRQIGESIMIGDEVVVTVMSSLGGQVRIGVNAPKEIAVHREETYKRIHGNKNSKAVNNNGFHRPSMQEDSFMCGCISSLNYMKGYGFIYAAGHDDTIFFHASSVTGDAFNDLYEGMDVEFRVIEGGKGLKAVEVTEAP